MCSSVQPATPSTPRLGGWNINVATYYVDPTSGLDTNPGTSTGTAWQTVAKLNNSTFAAGDSVLFQAGGVWREQLNVPSSGTSGNPITFGSYGTGNAPVLNGTDVLTGWTLSSGSIYQAS